MYVYLNASIYSDMDGWKNWLNLRCWARSSIYYRSKIQALVSLFGVLSSRTDLTEINYSTGNGG